MKYVLIAVITFAVLFVLAVQVVCFYRFLMGQPDYVIICIVMALADALLSSFVFVIHFEVTM